MVASGTLHCRRCHLAKENHTSLQSCIDLSTGNILLIYLSVKHALHVHKSSSSTTRFAKHSCLLKTYSNQLNVKNLEKSTELSEFLKLHNVLKFTTSLGKKFQMLTILALVYSFIVYSFIEYCNHQSSRIYKHKI